MMQTFSSFARTTRKFLSGAIGIGGRYVCNNRFAATLRRRIDEAYVYGVRYHPGTCHMKTGVLDAFWVLADTLEFLQKYPGYIGSFRRCFVRLDEISAWVNRNIFQGMAESKGNFPYRDFGTSNQHELEMVLTAFRLTTERCRRNESLIVTVLPSRRNRR